MGEDRYPLEAVRTVRGAARDEAAEALRGALAALDAARSRHARAMERLAELRAEERARIEKEGKERRARCTAATLQAEERYRARRRADEAKLADALARRASEVRDAEDAVDRARADLTRAGGEAEAVERHRERWADRARREADRKADDELDEQGAHRSHISEARFRDP